MDDLARPLPMEDLQAMLLSMDVDGLRRALQAKAQRAGKETAADCSRPAGKDTEPTPQLALLRKQFSVRLRVGEGGSSRQFELVHERVMGKIAWPAAEALASYFLTQAGAAADNVLIELGAGCALPSLAAAASGAFGRVIATDCSADRVDIARRNGELNGLHLLETHHLDFCELDCMDELVGAAPGGCVICAADVHYDPEAMCNLISSAASLMRRRAERETHWSAAHCPPPDQFILARSAVFEHNDSLMSSIALEEGLRQVESRSLRAGGLLHAASPTLFEPNPNDHTDLFVFVLSPCERDQARGHAAG
ncbi:hypothetical protein T492DRAFT_1061696 [Pavlovales sp. CCMP2436]|nr:hypothetical protein T492DRAFT_1061696 [Pavlovales sp. CCMP2436]|mmetsp:Transcript_21251/g.53877  ORF Transcript_21251/g.53877 Transcript_21251/m.53877 type:complete len:309 (+) Transcript_21251:50-976(+)